MPPRSSGSDYPVHQTIDTAGDTLTIAAALVPPERVRKIFSFDVDKNYVVVEVAIYPQGGRSIEVDINDFSLKVGSDDTSEIGVIVGSGKDPVTGRNQTRTEVYTGESVGVTNPAPPPPPASSPSARDIEAKMRD